MFLGSKDDVAHVGYIPGKCPKCGAEGVMSVYESKRKITLNVLVALPVGNQVVVECRQCNTRFAIPKQDLEALNRNMMSADEMMNLASRVSRLPSVYNPNIMTYYRLLQVDPAADTEVIEAAFKRLALKNHPDRAPGPEAEERMRELIEAREVLMDPRRRAAYDRQLGISRPEISKLPDAMRAEDV